ncbi:MAG: bifunctional diaminohydroxyphosphoribosylaminopyrimidine deaminase/5-amino-6-(5-phosphoribosylamino)uracil reductase RibD [Pseudomonadota bacterium]|nr:bifunctional diaminohydroxyphosphoribosylaminopyrimidine deaminase/5-amino-6-(5-phosphoribosylamino)uracil reductase RibD [Pseudomonadota bacterium]
MPTTNSLARDEIFMSRALKLAEQGRFTTKPNPMVGCVIVDDQKIIAEGWHQCAGGPHAEINALHYAGAAADGAEMFVTLEPCSHHGRTGPCVEALLEAGIARVVVAMSDPNPKVAGNGLRRLREAGVDVLVGVAGDQATELNDGFVKRMVRGRPRLRVKLAASLDGQTAAGDGSSQWITDQPARADVHRLRAGSCAVVTGYGTVDADDPRLNARVSAPVEQPLRVVIDAKGQLSPQAALFGVEGPVLVVTATDQTHKHGVYDERTEVISVRSAGEGLDLAALMDELGGRGCNEVLLEAGAGLAGAFVNAGLVDEIVVYLAPDLLGVGGRGMFEIPEVRGLNDRLRFEFHHVKRIGRDLRVVLRPGARPG